MSSGSEWVRISTWDDEYNKGMNGMNSSKMSDIKGSDEWTCTHMNIKEVLRNRRDIIRAFDWSFG